MTILKRVYSQPGLTGGSLENALTKISSQLGNSAVTDLSTELCFYIDVQGEGLLTLPYLIC